MLYPKSAILGLSFLDPKDLCLPNHFSRGSLQKRSISTYLTWCQRRNWVASMIELTLICNPSYVSHMIWTFSGHYLSQSKDLRKILQNHENIWSVADLSSVKIAFYSNSRDRLFWKFMMSKINPLIHEQKWTVSARLVNSILYLHKK